MPRTRPRLCPDCGGPMIGRHTNDVHELWCKACNWTEPLGQVVAVADPRPNIEICRQLVAEAQARKPELRWPDSTAS